MFHRIMLIAVGTVALIAVAPEAQGSGGTPITSCGQTLTTNAVLTQDLYCPGSAGIVVGASGITIDLKGFTLRGDRSVGDNGIDDLGGYDKIAVKNGVVRNFDFGARANGADELSFSNVLASGNYEYGFLVVGSSASFASSTASGNGGVGIAVVGALASVKSSATSGNDFGIDIIGASGSVTSSTASGNSNWGIVVEGVSASVTSSTATGNGQSGLLVRGDAARIKNNQADANGFFDGASDLDGLGILVEQYTTAPVGTNTTRGNDDPAECSPASLC